MLMTVLVSPASGFEIIGLFANSADAQSYAGDCCNRGAELAECAKHPIVAIKRKPRTCRGLKVTS